MFTPPKHEGGKRLEGSADEQVRDLITCLLEEKKELFYVK
jgi:electron transfer flavoprotein beta subunit